MSKEWKLILDYDFDETGANPSDVDVTGLSEFFIETKGLTNKSTATDSAIWISLNNIHAMQLSTQKNSNANANRLQHAWMEHNGLIVKQNVSNAISGFFENFNPAQVPYCYRKIEGDLKTMQIKANSSYECISGNIKIYAR